MGNPQHANEMMNSFFTDSSTAFSANDVISAEAEQFSTSEKSDGSAGFVVGLCMGGTT